MRDLHVLNVFSAINYVYALIFSWSICLIQPLCTYTYELKFIQKTVIIFISSKPYRSRHQFWVYVYIFRG